MTISPEDQPGDEHFVDDQSDVEPSEVIEEFDDMDDEPQQELSLEKLSQAYAEVMQERLAGETAGQGTERENAELINRPADEEPEEIDDEDVTDSQSDESSEDSINDSLNESIEPELELINLVAAKARMGRSQKSDRTPQSEDDLDNAGCDLSPSQLSKPFCSLAAHPIIN